MSAEREPLSADKRSEPQWLVERGQPEGFDPPEWHGHEGWTRVSYEAWMFPTRDEAEQWIAQYGLEARATEHLFFERYGAGSDDLRHDTRRMLQALDGYWEHCEGGRERSRTDHDAEDWWTRFERYRKRVEEGLRA